MKFSIKLTLLFSALILITGAGISYFVYISNLRTLEAHIEDRLKNQAFHTMQQIDMMLFERYGDIKTLASDSTISSRKSSPQQITERLRGFKKNYMYYSSLSFFNMNRVRIADTEGVGIGMQNPFSKYWPEIAEGKDITYSISKPELLDTTVVHFAAVVKDKNGTPSGVVVTRLPLDIINEMISRTTGIYNIKKDFWIDLTDKDGLIIYSNHDNHGILKEASPHWGFVRESLDKGIKTGTVKHAHLIERGEEIMAFCQEQGYQDFKGNGWTLMLDVPTRIAFASAVELRNRILVISVIISLFAFFIVRFLSGRASKTIERLSAAAEEVAGGNLDVEVEIKTRDETGRLAETFNKMVLELKGNRDKLLAYSSCLGSA